MVRSPVSCRRAVCVTAPITPPLSALTKGAGLARPGLRQPMDIRVQRAVSSPCPQLSWPGLWCIRYLAATNRELWPALLRLELTRWISCSVARVV